MQQLPLGLHPLLPHGLMLYLDVNTDARLDGLMDESSASNQAWVDLLSVDERDPVHSMAGHCSRIVFKASIPQKLIYSYHAGMYEKHMVRGYAWWIRFR